MSDVREFYATLGVDLPDRKGPWIDIRCFNPGHDRDRNPSCGINLEHGGFKCHACDAKGGAYDAAVLLGRSPRDAAELCKRYELGNWDDETGEGGATPSNNRATAQLWGERGRTTSDDRAYVHRSGCSLQQYAEAKRLPAEFLSSLGISEFKHSVFKTIVMRIPYRDADGAERAVRIRKALHKDPDGSDGRFLWKKGSKLMLYGLDRLNGAKEVVVVEGESDCHTLWHHGIAAVGLPGANGWKEDRDAPHIDGVDRIYVIVEPDTGGDAVLGWLSRSRIKDRAWIVDLGEHKDPSGLHLADPDRFPGRFREALEAAEPWRELAARYEDAERREAGVGCAGIVSHPRILDLLARDAHRAGLVGEEALVKLLYLATISRLFKRPVSVAVKGPSSGGKSYTVERALRFHPPSAYHEMTGMSERGLIYDEEPLQHKMLVIYEAAGMDGAIASYVVRSLLSEGRLRYLTTGKDHEGIKGRWIEREGPTGLITSTTAVHLHPENETRLLSVTVNDTPEQTRAVLIGIADTDDDEDDDFDLGAWHELQRWLELGDHRVTIPYRRKLAERIPPQAVRLRRDFKAVLTLIKAHALLHQASRRRDDRGRIVACHEDYAVVRGIVVDLVSEAVKATVSPAVRETVAAVEQLGSEPNKSQVARHLGVDHSAGQRRVDKAIADGYLRNLEDKRNRPAKLVLGDPLPDDVEILPGPEEVGAVCTYARQSGGINAPLLPAPDGRQAEDDPVPSAEELDIEEME
jgi:hypothetical protein